MKRFKEYQKYDWYDEKDTRKRYIATIEEAFKKNFISENLKNELVNIVNEYADILVYSLEQQVKNKDISENAVNGNILRLEQFRNGKYYMNGEQIYICYTKENIKAAIDLSILGLLNEGEYILDLNSLARRIDGVKMVARLTGEDINLKGDQSSYKNFAIENDLFLDDCGDDWANQNLSHEELIYMFRRGFGYTVGDHEDCDNTFKTMFTDGPSINYRWGSYYSNMCVKLQAGEPLRNGDVLSLSREYLFENYNENYDRGIDYLLSNNNITDEERLYIFEEDYYNSYQESESYDYKIGTLSYPTEFSHYYGMNNSFVTNRSPVTDWAWYRLQGGRGIYCTLIIDQDKYGVKDLKKCGLEILEDYGFSNKESLDMMNYTMNRTYNDDGKPISKVYNDVEVEVFYNIGEKVLFIEFRERKDR